MPSLLQSLFLFVEEDGACRLASGSREISLSKCILTPPASKLIELVVIAKSEVENDMRINYEEYIHIKKGTPPMENVLVMTKPQTVFVSVTSDMIESNLLYPIFNHTSVVSIAKKEYIESTYHHIKLNHLI